MKLSAGLAGMLICLWARPTWAQSPTYQVVVVSESGDMATWLTPSGPRLTPDRIVPVGVMPSDIDGPHNVTVAPDGKSYYITVAHGTPFGSLWKLDTRNDSILGKSQVELFPTTVSLTPDGQLALVANSDFHGDHPRTNVVSVIHTPTMCRACIATKSWSWRLRR
jgi:DNA-binding beta-propeller fold protein YncE